MTVMKIYRRSIKKSTSMYTLKPIVVILALFLLMTIGNLKGFLVFLVIELCVLSFIVAYTATQLFYVVLTENSLIVQNPAYRFWYAEFQFNTIEKIEIGYKGGLSRPYIQVMTPAKKSWRYVTDLVDERDYPDLIQTLREKGFTVETPGLHHILNKHENL